MSTYEETVLCCTTGRGSQLCTVDKKTWRAEIFRSILLPRNTWFSNTRMGSICLVDGWILPSQVKLILSPKQRAKPAASRTRTCTNAAVCIASGECPSRFWHRVENESVSGHAKMPPASHQVSATLLRTRTKRLTRWYFYSMTAALPFDSYSYNAHQNRLINGI